MTLEELEKRVQVLEDVYAIQNLKAKYCQLADDNYNPEETIKLFTEDGLWDGGLRRFHTDRNDHICEYGI